MDRIAPDRGPAEGGTVVRVRGEHFSSDTRVELAGVPQQEVDVIDEFELLFVTESGAPGAQTLQVITSAGVGILPGAFTYEEGLSIASLSPDRGASAGGYTIEVRGEGFRPETEVVLGGREALETRFISDSLLEVVVPPGESGAQVDLLLYDERVARRSAAFTYVRSPRLVQLFPGRAAASGGAVLRLDAVGFDTGCVVRFGNREAAVRESAGGALEVVAPGGPPGAVQVSWSCEGRGQGLLDQPFTWLTDEEEGEISFWPRQGFRTGGEIVTFVLPAEESVSTVFFGNNEGEIVAREGRFLQTLTPAAAAAGEVLIRLERDGEEGSDLEERFRYVAPPVFDALQPSTSPLAGGTHIDVSGIALDGVDELLIDDQSVEMLSLSPASATFVSPRAPAGDALLKARVGSLILSTNLRLTYRDDVRFDAFFPRTGPTGGGSDIWVLGKGFDGGCTIRLGDRTLETQRYGTSALRATVPQGEGSVGVEVVGCADVPSERFPDAYRYADPAIFPGGVAGGSIAGEITVSVREFGSFERIEGATVMVQTRSTSPYVAVTDAEGEVTFRGDDLYGPQTVTAWGEGRGVGSFADVDARRVTIMLDSLPTPPCTPGEPGCDPPPPPPPVPPPGTATGYLTGLDKVQALPPGTEPYGRVSTTTAFRGLPNPSPGAGSTRTSDGRYTITARLGDFALVAFCGYRDVMTGAFTPRTMGLVRGLSIRPGDGPLEVDIDCNLPLTRELTVKLDNAPGLVQNGEGTWASRFRAELVYDLGTEGFLEDFGPFTTTDPLMTLGGLPPLVGPLAGVRFNLTAGAYPQQGTLPSSVAYARGLGTYANVVRPPALMPIPRFTVPAPTDSGDLPRLRDGYVEWAYDGVTEEPDFFYLTVTADNAGFSRWSVFVPGNQRSFHLASFPTFSGVGGPAPPAGSLRVFVRAVRLDNFDYRAFDRGVLDTRRWRSTATSYETLPIRVSTVQQ